jgi:hypothetical protein
MKINLNKPVPISRERQILYQWQQKELNSGDLNPLYQHYKEIKMWFKLRSEIISFSLAI